MVQKKYILLKKINRVKEKNNKNQLRLRIVILLGVTLSLVIAGFIFYQASDYVDVSSDLPAIEGISLLLDIEDGIVNQPTQILDRNRRVLYTIQNPYATIESVTLEAIPSRVIEIFSVLENEYFYPQFSGINVDLFYSAYLVDSFLMPFDEHNKIDKIALLATQLQETYSKDMILTWFLNHVDFGNHTYGINSAAGYYFDKTIDELNDAEIALLAAISTAPDHNPVASPILASERQQAVLGFMLQKGLLTDEEALSVNESPIEISNPAYEPEKEWEAFFDLVFNQVGDFIDSKQFLRGGFEVVTTLDSTIQEQVLCSQDYHLSNLSSDERSTIENCEAAGFIPSLRDSEKSLGSTYDSKVLVLDTENGDILAYFSNDKISEPKSGNILDPFVYLTGFTRGYYPSSMLLDVPSLSLGILSDGYDYHGVVNARESLRNDYASATIDLISKIGIENLFVNFKLLGINDSDTNNHDNFLTGEFDSDFLNTSFAYSLFSNKGFLIGYEKATNDVESFENSDIQPNSILILKDKLENIYYEHSADYISISTHEDVYLINDILTDFQFDDSQKINPRAYELILPIGIQVSGNVEGNEQWAIGYSPKRLTAVWTKALPVEGQDFEMVTKISPEASSYLLNGIIKFIHSNLNMSPWTVPNGITNRTICYPSGNLPTSNCMETREEIFKKGDEPQQIDSLYQNISVNRQTGKLATIFTPQEYVEEKIFLVLPDKAKLWGYENEIVQPPSEYDFLFDIAGNPNAPSIYAPANFSYQHGIISIFGDVGIKDFDSYRVTIGKGLYPTKWELVHEDDVIKTFQTELAKWDTDQLNGLFIIRLQALNQDSILSTTYSQVSIDNKEPIIKLINPSIKTQTTNELNIQVEVSDEIGVESVQFFINTIKIADFSTAPYSLLWEIDTGNYDLMIRAQDFAGNVSETTYPIVIK